MKTKDTKENNIFFETIKDKLDLLSDEDLINYCELFCDSDKFHLLYAEINRRKDLKLHEFRKQNPNVPDNATKLTIGKNYSGRADGKFEIKTINGKLWFVEGHCCEFGEI